VSDRQGGETDGRTDILIANVALYYVARPTMFYQKFYKSRSVAVSSVYTDCIGSVFLLHAACSC